MGAGGRVPWTGLPNRRMRLGPVAHRHRDRRLELKSRRRWIVGSSPALQSELVAHYFLGWLAMIWSLILLYVA
jgi:hypothetical protein